jgi:type I restriction enzyme S subunit
VSETQIETIELGDVAEFVRGINFKPDDVVSESTPGVVACMRTKNVQAELDQSDVWFVGRQFVKRKEQMLSHGDILISSANSWNLVGKCCWIPDLPWESTFGGFVTVLRANRNKAFPRYLYHWFSSPNVQDFVRSFGRQTTNISNLDISRCLKMPIPLPPLSEQKRIAEILDRAEALRSKRRAALALLDELTQSIFLDMFGDPAVNPHKFPTVQLSSLVRVNDRLNYGVVQPGDDVADGVPLVRVSDLTGGKVADSNLKRISKEIDSSYKRSRLNGDEVLISCVGTVGSIALVEESQKGFNIARAVARVPLVDTCNRVFIAEYLRSHHVQRYFTGELRTVSQPTLNIKQIGETGIQIPPIGMQNEFEIRKVQVDHLRQRQERAALVLDEYFSSLQQRAFRGDL